MTPNKLPPLPESIESLRGLARLIRSHGTCAPLALETVANNIEQALRQSQSLPAGAVAVAWLIRDRKTKVVWMDENSHFGSETEAALCAMDMNDEIDDADFEAFPVFAGGQ